MSVFLGWQWDYVMTFGGDVQGVVCQVIGQSYDPPLFSKR